jgi:hypothetical protein
MNKSARHNKQIGSRNRGAFCPTYARQTKRTLPHILSHWQTPQYGSQFSQLSLVFFGPGSHPQLCKNHRAKNSRSIQKQTANLRLRFNVPITAKIMNPTGCINQRHSGFSWRRRDSKSLADMNVSESPNLIANSRIRPRLEKSSNAAKTAARFVFAPASLIASLNSPLGISNVVFIYKIFAIFTSKSRFLYSLYPILVRPPTSALAPSDIRDPPSAIVRP